jgi:1,4-dihydroxy-2-naphthoyl-CoA hydrolase
MADLSHLLQQRTLDTTLGVRYLELNPERVVAELEVGPAVHQPFGYLHGGASVALAESVASIGGYLNCPEGYAAFGMEINANHLRPKREGLLRATGVPLHRGQSTQVWEVRLTDERDRLICISRCTLAVVKLDRGSPNP